jgi:hypothetical protein
VGEEGSLAAVAREATSSLAWSRAPLIGELPTWSEESVLAVLDRFGERGCVLGAMEGDLATSMRATYGARVHGLRAVSDDSGEGWRACR